MIFRVWGAFFAAVIMLFAAMPNLQAQGVQYGKTPTFPPAPYDYSVDTEGKAITLGLTNFQVVADDGKTTEGTPGPGQRQDPTDPVVSRVFSIVLPVTNGTPAKAPYFLQGLVRTNEGGQATMIVIINGQSTIFSFPKNTNESFVHTVNFSAPSAGEIRLTLVLVAERDIQFRGASSMLLLDSIDSDASIARRRGASKRTK
jgi:hypothetical protein